MNLKEGDVVRLKSGGPKMTVTGVGAQPENPSVSCSWFVGGKNNSALFPLNAIEAVSTETISPPVVGASWIAARRG